MSSSRFIATCALIAVLIGKTNAQSFDDIIAARRAIDCRDVAYNALDIISSLYAHNETDSLYSFLSYWEDKCGGRNRAIQHCYNILDLKTNKAKPDSVSSKDIALLIQYREIMENEHFMYRWWPALYGDNPEEKAFYNYLRQIAQNSQSDFEDGNKILAFYQAQKPNFNEIKQAPKTTKLSQAYHQTYLNTDKLPQFHIGFVTGFTQHYGKLNLFGTRPTFGFVVGMKQLKHNYDIVMDFRAGDSPNSYDIIYDDELIATKDYMGMYIGFEYAYDIYYSKKIDVSLSPGIGWDRITALYLDNDYGEDPKFVNSFNYNGGLVLKYKYGKKGGYLGIHARYNWANYQNKGGTELSGEYFNLRLVWGNIFNAYRAHRLKMLE